MRVRIIASTLAIFCGSAFGQSELFRVRGDAPSDLFGSALAGGGDVDGDGIPDLLIAAKQDGDLSLIQGTVRIVSGRDGGVLYVIDGDIPNVHLGDSVAFVGDLDHDGGGEFAIGDVLLAGDGLSGHGRVRVFSGRTGSVLRVFHGPLSNFSPDVPGVAAAAGDVDADGTPDILVGWPNADTFFHDEGMIQVFSGATGQTLFTATAYSFSMLGKQLDGMGDLNHDGFADVAASDTPTIGSAEIRFFSGKDGASIQVLALPYPGDEFSGMFTAAGDVDQDGTPDAALTVDSFGQASFVRVVSGASWQSLFEVHGSAMGDGFGTALDGGGDLDGDSIPDLVVGAPGAGTAGKLYAYSGSGGVSLFALPGNSMSAPLGSALAFAGDVDADGRDDVVLTTEFAASTATAASVVAVVTSAVVPRVGHVTEYGHGCGASAAQAPHLQFTGRPTAGVSVALSLTNIKGANFAMLFVGNAIDDTRIHPTECTIDVQPLILLVSNWPVQSWVPSTGWAVAPATVPSGLAGQALMLQAFLPDSAHALGFVNSNGVAITFG